MQDTHQLPAKPLCDQCGKEMYTLSRQRKRHATCGATLKNKREYERYGEEKRIRAIMRQSAKDCAGFVQRHSDGILIAEPNHGPA